MGWGEDDGNSEKLGQGSVCVHESLVKGVVRGAWAGLGGWFGVGLGFTEGRPGRRTCALALAVWDLT